jgi:hypothetical protein
MGLRRSPLNTGLRIAIALAAGIVVGGAAPHTGSGGVGQPSSCHSRSDCGPRVMGGLRITFTGWSCTTGFVARDTQTRKLVVLTAGHCLAGSGLSALWSHHGVPIGRAFLEAFHPGTGADVGAIELADARAGNEVYGASNTDIRRVTGSASNASQAVGSKVCRSGATSAWRCGSIVAADVDSTIGGRLIHHTWWTDFPSAAGDSGSPVLDQDGRVAGIMIATTPTRSVYSTIDWIATELHVRPCVKPSCD